MLSKLRQSILKQDRNSKSIPFLYKKEYSHKIYDLVQMAEFGKISGGIFHDLLNPLTAISLSLEKESATKSIKESKDFKKINQAISQSSQQVSKYLKILRNLVSQENIIRDFNLYESVCDIVDLLDYKIKKGNVTVNICPSRNFKYFGDITKFYQLIINILSNSIESYKNSSPEETVFSENKIDINILRQDDSYKIIIKDYGCGMTEPEVSQIFTPFYTTKTNGNGIGLATTKHILHQDFEGEIDIRSQKDVGTTCIMSFPINR